MSASRSRPRNAAATREAILHSAIDHFARSGYDGVGVRQIAQDAGVTAMLVNRYFGSKELLFAEAVETSFSSPVFIGEQSGDLASEAAGKLVALSASEAQAPQPFLIMMRSVSNPTAVRIVRDAIERHVGTRLARQLESPGQELRSEILLSVISGVLLMRAAVGTRALRTSSPQDIEEALQAVFTAIVADPHA